MKANVNLNFQGDEEPGLLGRAQNVRFNFFWAGPLNYAGSLPCAKTCLSTMFLLHLHPRSGQYWPSLVPPCQLLLNLESKLDPV